MTTANGRVAVAWLSRGSAWVVMNLVIACAPVMMLKRCPYSNLQKHHVF